MIARRCRLAALLGTAVAVVPPAVSPAQRSVLAEAAHAALAPVPPASSAPLPAAAMTAFAWNPSVASLYALAAVPDEASPDGSATAARTGPAVLDSVRRRHAVAYSDWYARRLAIHRIGSYTMLPLFAAEYALGNRLMQGSSAPPGWVKPTHVGVALGLGALFTTNTITGVWNLWDARHDPAGRTRRLIHSALMIAADAGFAYTGTLADGATHSLDGRRRHRNAALTSIGISTVGASMMWLWKD